MVVLYLVYKYKYYRRLSPLLIFDPLAVWDPTRTGEKVCDGFVSQLERTMGVHTGLPVLTMTRGVPSLAQSCPVVGNLLSSVLVKLAQTVGEGAGISSITVAGVTIALTQDHLHWPGTRLRCGGQ